MSIPRTCSGHLYEVLEVERGAPLEVIRRQYKKLALQYHPDRNNGTTHEKFQEIEEAHRVLSDNEKRKLYDLIGRENMKTIGDNPIVNMMLTNPGGLLALFGSVVVMTGLLFFGLLLAFWRFDRQFAVANHGRPESFSWWWVSLFFWPMALVSGAIGIFSFKKILTESGIWEALPCLSFVSIPVGLLVIVLMLNGSVAAGTAEFILIVYLITRGIMSWHSLYRNGSDEADVSLDEVEAISGPQRAFFGQKVGLILVFALLLFVRTLQEGPSFISMWLVALPLILMNILSLQFDLLPGLVKLYLLLFWTQKLNVELNGHVGYDPKAITASLPLFLLFLAIFVGTIMATAGFVSQAQNVRSSTTDSPSEDPFVL